MKKLLSVIVLSYLVLNSCLQENKSKSTNNPELTVNNSSAEITIRDTKDQIRAKLKLGAEMDGNKFGETNLYDEYFNDEITKFFMKNENGERVLTAVVYNNKLRYMKMLIQHVGDTTFENKEKHINRIKGGIEKAVQSNLYQISEDNYLKYNENGDNWYSTIIISESKKTGKQNYWHLIAPEADYNYLKYMATAFQMTENFDVNFIMKK